jgi:hypothetical protein
MFDFKSSARSGFLVRVINYSTRDHKKREMKKRIEIRVLFDDIAMYVTSILSSLPFFSLNFALMIRAQRKVS